jgi:sugar lactone lactonase YvrE
MRKLYLLLLLSHPLSAPRAASQSALPPTSTIETIAGGEHTGIPGPEFGISSVSGLAADSDGNVYFSIEAKSQVFRLGVGGKVTVFAGSGVREKHVDGALSAESPLFNPRSLAVDHADNVYIICDNALVRVDAATRVLSTVFTTPYTRPGSPNSIMDILEMVVGPDGNLYLSDGGDSRIKEYSFASGAVTVLAGNGTAASAQTGIAANLSSLKYPQAVAVGRDGTVYFSTLEPCVFRITPEDGKLQAVSIALAEEKTPLGEYDIPSYIALDEQGHLFVAQANRSRVLRVDLKTSVSSVYAGTGQQGFNGDGIPADLATVRAPLYVVSDPAGNLIISENHRIRSVKSSTRLIWTRVGNGNWVIDDERTLAIHAQLWEPANAVAAPNGSLYISSSLSNRLMRLGPDGDLTSAAGGGSFVHVGSEAGLAARVALFHPQGVWVEKNNDIFFSDYDNRIIRHLVSDSGSVTNFATTPKNFNSAGLFLYHAGTLVSDGIYFYLSDPNGGCVWRISRGNGAVELYVGIAPGAHGPASDGGAGRLVSPAGLALDSAGNLYIADGSLGGKDGRILRVDGATRSITTVLSNLRQPSGLAFQSYEILCFAESGGHQVRCLNLNSHAIHVIAGTGVAGLKGDGGPAECAQLNRPSGISFDRAGDLYIADTGNQRIRRVHPGLRQAYCPLR